MKLVYPFQALDQKGVKFMTDTKKEEQAAVLKALESSGVVNMDTTLGEILKSTSELSDITVQWGAVYDSDKWALVYK